MSKCLTQKMHSLKNTHNHKKEPREIMQKKNFKKKFQKKIEERLPRFSRSQIGGGGYTCVMVVTLLYTCDGTEMGKQAGGHR